MHGMHTLCRDPRPVPRRWGPCIWHMASAVSIASDAAAGASGVMAATKNLPVFRRLRVLVRATVDLAIVEQARRQRRRRLGSPAGVATVVSKRTARVLAAEGNSLVAGGRVGAIAEVWVLHTSGSSLREGGGRTYDGDVVRLDEFVVVVVASAERRGGGRGRRPGRGTGHGGRLAVGWRFQVTIDRYIPKPMRRSGLVEKDAPRPAATRRTRGAVRPSFVLSTGHSSRPLQLAARPLGD